MGMVSRRQKHETINHTVSAARVVENWKLTRPSYSVFCTSFQASRSWCSMRRFTSASHSSAILLAAALESPGAGFVEEEAIRVFTKWWSLSFFTRQSMEFRTEEKKPKVKVELCTNK